MGLLKNLKDTIVSYSAEKYLDTQLKKYGELIEFNINSKENKVFIRIRLKGEKYPSIISIRKYKITKEKKSSFILIEDLYTSKEWVNLLLEDFLKDKKIPLPDKYSWIIKMLI